MAGPRSILLLFLVVILCACECEAGKKKKPCKYNKQKYNAGDVIEALEDNCVELKCSMKGKKTELKLMKDCVCGKEAFVPVDDFIATYNKTYENEAEAEKRRVIFLENYETMEDHNKLYESGASTFRMGVNEYFDMTYDEVVSTLTGAQKPSLTQSFTRQAGYYYIPKDMGEEPEYLDYRDQGAMNPIRKQGSCGSCWAFTAVSNIESSYFIKHRELLQMSEQDLVDCSRKNSGCDGGNMWKAFTYVTNEGVAHRSEYEYTAKDGKCKDTQKKHPIAGMKSIRMNKESELLNALVHEGPISIHMYVSPKFQKYKKGVLVDDLCPLNSINHAMLLIGYGTENGQDYWLLRNSWGESWGEQGYIKMARNVENDCSISKYAVFPLINAVFPLITDSPACEDMFSNCALHTRNCWSVNFQSLCPETCGTC